jgi:hypothetical protein
MTTAGYLDPERATLLELQRDLRKLEKTNSHTESSVICIVVVQRIQFGE